MRSRTLVAMVAGATLGGWMAIMAPAVVTIALRLREFDPSGLPSQYALILALGWLTMMAALVISGTWGDAIRRRTESRALVARIGVPLIALGGVLLALAPSPDWLLVTWIVVQIPSAMVITTALAESGDVLPRSRRGLASGLVGAAPIAALLLGSLGVRFLADSLAWAFVIPALVGALLAAPLMLVRSTQQQGDEPVADSTTGPIGSPVLWSVFVVASFLLSWSTSTTNGFIVTFVQYPLATPVDEIAGLSTLTVVVASGVAMIASVVAGAASSGRSRSPWLWAIAAAVCGIGLLVLVLAPSQGTFLLAALCFGVAFGAANGVELAVILLVRRDPTRLGRDLGLFTAVTTAPYVLVPSVATVLLASDPRAGVLTLFTLAGSLALLAAILMAAAWTVRRTRSGRPRGRTMMDDGRR